VSWCWLLVEEKLLCVYKAFVIAELCHTLQPEHLMYSTFFVSVNQINFSQRRKAKILTTYCTIIY